MTSPALPTHDDGAPFPGLDEAIDRAVGSGRIVGAVVLVARHGRIVHQRAAGFADREAGRPMALDSVFLLSSVTKPLVALAAMRLAEAGRLDLDAPVTRWLPGFRPRLADGSEPSITAHQLLTHTAGLVYPDDAEHGGPYRALRVSNGLDDIFTSEDENLGRIAAAPLAYPPGTGWIYSLATDVLGALVAAVAGEPLPQALRSLVLAPLGMADSGFAVADRARLVTHYVDGDPAPVVMPARHHGVHEEGSFTFAPGRIFEPAAYPSGGGGMAGTAGDVLRALEAVRSGHTGVLSPSGASRMREARVGAQAETLAPGWGFSYAGAVLVDPAQDGTPQSPGTVSWGGVYGHTWFIDPARALTVVTLTNTTFEGLFGRFPLDVRDAVCR